MCPAGSPERRRSAISSGPRFGRVSLLDADNAEGNGDGIAIVALVRCPREFVVGTAAPGDLRKYYREQVQDLVYGAMMR